MAAMFHLAARSWRKGPASSTTQITRVSCRKAAGVAVVRASPLKKSTKARPPPTMPT